MSSNNRYDAGHLVILCLVLFLGGIFPHDSALRRTATRLSSSKEQKKRGRWFFILP